MLLKTVWVVFVFEQVGDIVSIIDMPPAHESSWWRGKNRFEVINAFNNFMMICCWHFIYIHTHPFNGPFFGTTQVSWYQKGKTNVDFTEARDSEWQWHQLGHMQVCTSLQTNNHASTLPLSFYRPDALPATQPTASKHWHFIYVAKNTVINSLTVTWLIWFRWPLSIVTDFWIFWAYCACMHKCMLQMLVS